MICPDLDWIMEESASRADRGLVVRKRIPCDSNARIKIFE